MTVKHDGKTVDAVALASKNDFLYVFDRVTGKPVMADRGASCSAKRCTR